MVTIIPSKILLTFKFCTQLLTYDNWYRCRVPLTIGDSTSTKWIIAFDDQAKSIIRSPTSNLNLLFTKMIYIHILICTYFVNYNCCNNIFFLRIKLMELISWMHIEAWSLWMLLYLSFQSPSMQLKNQRLTLYALFRGRKNVTIWSTIWNIKLTT